MAQPLCLIDGQITNELFVPKDTIIYINIPRVNHDEEIWGPDAMEWLPDRWLSALPTSVSDARVPGVYSNMCVLPMTTQ